MQATARRRYTYAEYLALEESTDEKHEFFEGHILAMAGGTFAHSKLKINLTLVVGAALKGKRCQPYDSDQRIRVPATTLATYPDLSVVCGRREPDQDDRHAAVNPTALFEVMSPSTSAYDRGQKFENYRRLPTLRHFVAVEAERVHVDVFTLNEHGRWELQDHGPGEIVELPHIDVRFSVDELYEGWEPDPVLAPGA